MIVWLRMLLNYLVVFPDLVPLELDDFVDECLGYACSQVVVLRLLVEWNGDKVLVNGHHESLQVHLLDELVHVLREFQQALNNQTRDLRLVRTVLVLGEQAKEHDEDVRMVTILQHSQHRGVQILQNELTLLVRANLVKIVNKQSLQELVDKSLHFVAGDLLHDLFA